MAQLFLYLAFVLVATISGGQGLQSNSDNVLDHAISFFDQDEETSRDQLVNDGDPDDYCSFHAEILRFGQCCPALFIPSNRDTHPSYSAYSARAPPVFLS